MAEDRRIHPEEEPISLEGPEEAESVRLVGGAGGGSSLRAFDSGSALGSTVAKKFTRPLNLTGQGATRCRVFHSKIAVASLEFMEGQINEWLDKEKIEVKAVGHVIGTMEGKRPEPNVVVVVWY